jgi:hypothetical protein
MGILMIVGGLVITAIGVLVQANTPEKPKRPVTAPPKPAPKPTDEEGK